MRSSGFRSSFVFGITQRWLLACVAAGSIAACSERNITSNFAFGDIDPPPVQMGVFRAGNVAGLDFVSGAERGVTDANGRFTCATNQPIAFSLGNVELGETVCATIVHPAALTVSGTLSDPAALNIARFLLLLDEDQIPDNGIVIAERLRSLADSWALIDFSAADFEAQLAQVLADLASVEGRATIALPSSTAAFVYLDASLSCAYSGVFVSAIPAGAFDARTEVVMSVFREPGTSLDVFDIRILRQHPQSQFYLEAEGTVELKALPSLISTGPNPLGRVSGEFFTPDTILGRWEDALVAQQPIDRTGSFAALRIGTDFGEFRVTGTYSRPAGTSSNAPVFGYVDFSFDGDVINGEAFDLYSGSSVTISGRRLPDSEQIELNVKNDQESSLATLTLDENGVPVSLDGSWPGVEGSSLRAVGCRLI